jgi:hypothetical protein
LRQRRREAHIATLDLSAAAVNGFAFAVRALLAAAVFGQCGGDRRGGHAGGAGDGAVRCPPARPALERRQPQAWDQAANSATNGGISMPVRAVPFTKDLVRNGGALEHGLMMPAMLIAMLLRLDLHSGRAGHKMHTRHAASQH